MLMTSTSVLAVIRTFIGTMKCDMNNDRTRETEWRVAVWLTRCDNYNYVTSPSRFQSSGMKHGSSSSYLCALLLLL